MKTKQGAIKWSQVRRRIELCLMEIILTKFTFFYNERINDLLTYNLEKRQNIEVNNTSKVNIIQKAMFGIWYPCRYIFKI
jgi:hypothetical protein